MTDGGEERQMVAPHFNRSATVGQLVPFTNYTFCVRAYTDSASDFSEKVVCLTGEDGKKKQKQIGLFDDNTNCFGC